MQEERTARILERLRRIYRDEQTAQETAAKMEAQFSARRGCRPQKRLNQQDVMLITYGDSISSPGRIPLETLGAFLEKWMGDAISAVHLLPIYPYTSDDGFSVTDYREVREDLGTWKDVEALADRYDLMLDAVINHISQGSRWFQRFLQGEAPYTGYFITANPAGDFSMVTRPRALPLLTAFDTAEGEKHVWTTFSADQIDLNYKNPRLLLDVLDVLLFYTQRGARFIRLDAIGFLWKEAGTSCINLPQTHEMVKLMRDVLDEFAPGTTLITETNVPHLDNIAYFGNGHDEAGLVYQFPLPPLVLFTFLTQRAGTLSRWAKGLDSPGEETTYFNFLASHDGIGLRPTEGILTDAQRAMLAEAALRRGGRVSYKDNGDGTKSPYELNINYQDALSPPDAPDAVRIARFIAANTILLSMQGVPGIYIHSLLGSRNDYYGVESTGINRRINREKLDLCRLEKDLTENTNRRQVFEEMRRRISIRRGQSAFSPAARQKVLELDDRIFALCRENPETGQTVYVLVNVSETPLALEAPELAGRDLLSGEDLDAVVPMKGLQCRWIETAQK